MKPYDNFINTPYNKNNVDLYYHRSAIFDAIKANLPIFNGKLLDTGCGKIPYRDYILKNSSLSQYVGLDIETALNYSDTVKPDFTWDGKKMPFEDSEFDCAMATEVLEHIPHPHEFLQEVYRVLKKGGCFFFTIPFLWPLHETPHDEYRYTPFSIQRHLEEAGFSQIKVEALGGWNASLAQMLGLWLKRSPMSVFRRKLLINLLFPFYKYLIKRDRKLIREGQMITGLSGTAIK